VSPVFLLSGFTVMPLSYLMSMSENSNAATNDTLAAVEGF